MSTHTKKNTKGTTILLRILAIVLGVIAIVLLAGIGYFRLPATGYYRASDATFKIPGLNTSFVPQGISYDESTESFFITGYNKDKTASPIYIVDKDNKVKMVSMENDNGSIFKGHAGGLSVTDKYIYIAGSSAGTLVVFLKEDVLNAENNGSVKSIGSFSCGIGEDDHIKVAYTTVHNGLITVGEFRKAQAGYESPDSHKFTTANGEKNGGLSISYRLDDDFEFGIDPSPVIAYSLPDMIQGMCFDANNMYLSSSSGPSFSHIRKYDIGKMIEITKITVNGTEVPLMGVDSTTMVSDVKAPPMAEEIEIVNGKMYTMCESACKAYVFGKITGATRCYATDISIFN